MYKEESEVYEEAYRLYSLGYTLTSALEKVNEKLKLQGRKVQVSRPRMERYMIREGLL